MKYPWFTLLFLLAMASTVRAQKPLVTSETPVNTSILHQWLHGGDPRLIAWAADFARRTHDTNIISEIPALLEHWTMPPMEDGDESQAAQRRAVIAVLDTLIQENVQVPIPAINTVAESFPSQAVILIGRLPVTESRVTLGDWTLGATRNWSGRTLARIASMMLAKVPESSFVASVVAASEEDLQVSVNYAGSEQGGGSGPICGDSIGRKISPGWPQIYAYDLVENDSTTHESLVIDLDGDHIAYRRFEENRPEGSCYGVEWLNPETRHRLIAHWLGIPEKDMTWQPVERISITWTDKADYQQRLGAFIESQREKLQATVQTLHQRGLLTANDATATLQGFVITATMPKLIVTIKCDIKPCPLN